MSEAGTEMAHRFPLRVYYEDTDAAGIVYYANYLRYAERARTEMLRGTGFASSKLMAENGLALGVRRCNVDYRRPARLDDELEVETRVVRVDGASLELEQLVYRDDEVLVAMDLKLGCMTLDGKPARLPGDVRQALREHLA
jgi:acyl-CoA thioester hydrolase